MPRTTPAPAAGEDEDDEAEDDEAAIAALEVGARTFALDTLSNLDSCRSAARCAANQTRRAREARSCAPTASEYRTEDEQQKE
jgi:hypothetical protein